MAVAWSGVVSSGCLAGWDVTGGVSTVFKAGPPLIPAIPPTPQYNHRYLAPECCRAKWYPVSDVWAVGVMSCYLLTGKGSSAVQAPAGGRRRQLLCGRLWGAGEPARLCTPADGLFSVPPQTCWNLTLPACLPVCLLQAPTPSWIASAPRCQTWPAPCAGGPASQPSTAQPATSRQLADCTAVLSMPVMPAAPGHLPLVKLKACPTPADR